MTIVLAAVFFVLAVTPTWPQGWNYRPTGKYVGKVQVIWLPHGGARVKCASLGTFGTGGFVRGCTCGGIKQWCGVRGKCVIYLDETAPHHLEHELAHCAGWEH